MGKKAPMATRAIAAMGLIPNKIIENGTHAETGTGRRS
jgi:hypothetical protein